MDSPEIRYAGADVLSLALIDARNRTLNLISEIERLMPDLLLAQAVCPSHIDELNPPLWLLGHAGWFQEYWVGRNMQRHLGLQCPPQPVLLASIEPRADDCFDPRLSSRAQRWTRIYPDLSSVKSYLLETLEMTLELLDKAAPTHEGLYFFRLALSREDQLSEQLIVMAQTLGLKLSVPPLSAFASRAPVVVPAMRWQMGWHSGAAAGGFSFDNEVPQHEVSVPEFEIDAQPVNWAQFVEFVDAGGYDDMTHWSDAGQRWLALACAAQGMGHDRRAPR